MSGDQILAETELALKDESVGTEKKGPTKSLTGKTLLPDWPHITPDGELENRFEGFTPGVDPPIEKFSLHLIQGQKKLSYLAVEHSSDFKNPQFTALERSFRDITPQVVLHEGPANIGQISNRETAIKYGETAFLHFLVQEYNANLKEGQKPIVIESADMPDNDWIQAFRDRGHTNEEIAVYDVLRKVNVVAEQIRRNNKLTDEQRAITLAELASQINSDFTTFISERGFPDLFEHLPREDGRQWNNETIREEIKRLTGQDLSANLSQLNVPRFKKMFDEEAEFRDEFVVRKIADRVGQYDRVLAVMGSSHVLREERALKELFGIE